MAATKVADCYNLGVPGWQMFPKRENVMSKKQMVANAFAIVCATIIVAAGGAFVYDNLREKAKESSVETPESKDDAKKPTAEKESAAAKAMDFLKKELAAVKDALKSKPKPATKVAEEELASVKAKAEAEIIAFKKKVEADVAALKKKAAAEAEAFKKEAEAEVAAAKKVAEDELATAKKKAADELLVKKAKEKAVEEGESSLKGKWKALAEEVAAKKAKLAVLEEAKEEADSPEEKQIRDEAKAWRGLSMVWHLGVTRRNEWLLAQRARSQKEYLEGCRIFQLWEAQSRRVFETNLTEWELERRIGSFAKKTFAKSLK
jgi:hypothetical protein